eukprot:COSAG01_NODE_50216_length_365_cov_0.774436_1_plen_91_part_01
MHRGPHCRSHAYLKRLLALLNWYNLARLITAHGGGATAHPAPVERLTICAAARSCAPSGDQLARRGVSVGAAGYVHVLRQLIGAAELPEPF